MNSRELLSVLQDRLPAFECEEVREGELRLRVSAASWVPFFEGLKKLKGFHDSVLELYTVSGRPAAMDILARVRPSEGPAVLHVKTSTTHEIAPGSLRHLWPYADAYEQEASELFGVKILFQPEARYQILRGGIAQAPMSGGGA